MLVLQRKRNQSIVIGDNIELSVEGKPLLHIEGLFHKRLHDMRHQRCAG